MKPHSLNTSILIVNSIASLYIIHPNYHSIHKDVWKWNNKILTEAGVKVI